MNEISSMPINDSDGIEKNYYDKINLFDVKLSSKEKYLESKNLFYLFVNLADLSFCLQKDAGKGIGFLC